MNIDAKVLEALGMLERGDWQQAHAIVQQHETQYAAWLQWERIRRRRGRGTSKR
jgi:hypothetical protein